MGWIVWIVVMGVILIALARTRGSLLIWTVAVGVALAVLGLTGFLTFAAGEVLWLLYLVLLVLFNIDPVRRRLVSAPLLGYIRKLLPPVSDTERTAIEAGTVWWEGELFRGDPRWHKLLATPAPRLTDAEQAFLDGPVEQLCALLDDWQISYELHDLPPAVWEFIKRNGLFGIIIPKQYGGLEFSALAHSSIVMKLASRSLTAGVTVMVPNSLGPAELLLHYGTEEQKNHYLPRLAAGEDIPCFALTNPAAGSDAGAIPDTGVVCRGQHEGEAVLGLRLNWEKRYITLGPVATVLGLAFKAYDPDCLLGGEADLGITCALIPASTTGVEIGDRHNPLYGAFMNGPTRGHDVFIPLTGVIGGRDGIGNGWHMLMDCLAAGRGISLPANGAGGSKLAARVTGAYARVRHQFGLPIGKFEGVEEALARIGGLTYMMDAARTLTTAGLDLGERPSVIAAIMKYYNTEGLRQVLNDAMDVHGGRGICIGPTNYLAHAYCSVPVAITVEGANILTRTMMIFGQGAMRCHPYLRAEIAAASNADHAQGLIDFDHNLTQHLGHIAGNKARAFLYGLTGSWLAPTPIAGPTAHYFQQLARMSAAYALLADTALLLLGGALKRKEKLSGRFADGLGYLYYACAALKRFEDDDRPAADLPLVQWVAEHCLYRIQAALDGILRNFPLPALGLALRPVVFPLGRRWREPDDQLGHQVADLLLSPSPARDRLTAGIYHTDEPSDITGRLEAALARVIVAEDAERKLKHAGRKAPALAADDSWLDTAADDGVISADEAERVRVARRLAHAVIMVDEFSPDLGTLTTPPAQ